MKEWKTYLLALLSLVIIILLLKNCSDNNGYENKISNLNDKLVKQEAELKTIIQKDSSKLYVMEQKLMGEPTPVFWLKMHQNALKHSLPL